nr:hypothetical protein CFP56_11052 [Quercus suber]
MVDNHTQIMPGCISEAAMRTLDHRINKPMLQTERGTGDPAGVYFRFIVKFDSSSPFAIGVSSHRRRVKSVDTVLRSLDIMHHFQ